MYQRRRARVLLAVLVLAALVLITVDFRSGEDGPLASVRGAATSAFGPAQDWLTTAVRPVGTAFASVSDLFRLRSENAALQARLSRLEERRESFSDLLRQNEELRRLLDMRRRSDWDVVAARTISLAPSNYEWTVTLDVGSDAGVARDNVVMNGDGLVGRVIQVTAGASRVLLAIDPNFTAASRVARPGETGPIDGRGGDLMRFRPLDPEADVQVGDEIVTSKYEGGIFPAGIPIGTVESVGDTTTQLSRDVRVRPYVDFTRLDTVLVVLGNPRTELPPVTAHPDVDLGELPGSAAGAGGS